MSSGFESDVAELAARLAAHSGGSFSAEVSVDLALEIVLNEIVQQACLATSATGAAVLLEREGEMVCRASSGINAPELGARLGESGLTAECIKTRQRQRCDDAQADPRADAEASRSLGVRSVMILPLLRNGSLAGVLEVFSSRPGAFGEREELNLEVLAQRILKNLERASQPSSAASRVAAQDLTAKPVASIGANEGSANQGLPTSRNKTGPDRATLNKDSTSLNREDEAATEGAGRSPRTGFGAVTYALGAAVLVCLLLLATLVGLRLGWRKAMAAHGQLTKAAVSETQAGTNAVPPQAAPEAGNSAAPESVPPVSVEKEAVAPPSTPAAVPKNSSAPEGSLQVFENGKEVFRMPPAAPGGAPSAARNAASNSVPKKEVRRASAVEPAGVVQLPPAAAAGSLLHRVEPVYPEEARQQRIQGAVVLDVRIGRDGAVQEAKLVSGQSLLADAAIAAVKQWRFKTRMVRGQAVEMQTRVTLNFRLPS